MRSTVVFLIVFGIIICSTNSETKNLHGSSDPVEDLLAILFPELPAHSNGQSRRNLAISKPPYDPADPVPCAVCTGMKLCTVLDGQMVEEVYYPKDPGKAETCNVIESLALRVSKEIFGNGRAFRDTEQCREIVMQYLCYFYGSDSSQYKNYCINQEQVSNTGNVGDLTVVRAPCRSFCVQVANVCANDKTFIQTCNRINCPPMESSCTPDPLLGGKTLDSSIGCSVPYYRTPYNTASALPRHQMWMILLTVTATAVVLSLGNLC